MKHLEGRPRSIQKMSSTDDDVALVLTDEYSKASARAAGISGYFELLNMLISNGLKCSQIHFRRNYALSLICK